MDAEAARQADGLSEPALAAAAFNSAYAQARVVRNDCPFAPGAYQSRHISFENSPAVSTAHRLHPALSVDVSRFDGIDAWQKAQELRTRVFAICERASFARDERLKAQLMESARSAPRGIADGFGRSSHSDFARCVEQAKGAHAALLRHVQEAFDGRHISRAERDHLVAAARAAMASADALVQWLREHPESVEPS